MTSDTEPVFDPKGRYLYFLSNRDFNLTFSAFEFNYLYTNPTRVYVGLLAADGPALFLPDERRGARQDEGDAAHRPAQPRAAAARVGRAPAGDAAGRRRTTAAVRHAFDGRGRRTDERDSRRASRRA